MRNFLKRLSLVLIALVSALGLTACGKDEGPAVTEDGAAILKVAFAECGYGREFLLQWEKAYNEAYPNEKIKLDPDGDAQMTQNIINRIDTGKNLPDIVMVLSTNWQLWAAKGKILEIDDVYEADAGLGDGTKMKDFIDPNISEFGLVNGHYYAVPWSVGTTGFVYNKGMFEEWGWEVPETVEELVTLCEKIKSDTGGTIAPFAWSTAVAEYWSFVTLNWWAQYEGAEKFKEFWKFETPDVYKQEGRLKALQTFERLVCGKDASGNPTGEAINSITNAKFMESQLDFVQGRAAMIPNGVWLENEMRNNLPAGFQMAMMPTPAIEGAKRDADGNLIDVNVNSSGDFILIPRGAKNPDAAKKFLAFINSKQGCEIFTRYTGAIRPFQYEPSKVEGLTPFAKDAATQWENAINLYQTSTSEKHFRNSVGLWPFYGSPYSRMVQDGDSAAEVHKAICDYVSQYWNTF